MKYTEEQITQIHNFGAFNYPPEKMANIIDMTIEEIQTEIQNKDSDFYKYFNAGKDKADYVIDCKLFELAQTGDLKALEQFEDRKNDR
ncbi:MAG TPA: hypothetical protein DD458_21075 [Prolixibacteraceae bacterium]|nr:MAG: hypothetical protein A2W92_16190 [Bacteroidetes bacterium GWA2_42_15]OFY01225.1 MAG: hypothetical protein A2W89_16005 [Bacteroidetes bacterium GWE2_42_39]HBL77729.1 hypothetical protein [Prolixibacteraceae bacterium]